MNGGDGRSENLVKQVTFLMNVLKLDFYLCVVNIVLAPGRAEIFHTYCENFLKISLSYQTTNGQAFTLKCVITSYDFD